MNRRPRLGALILAPAIAITLLAGCTSGPAATEGGQGDAASSPTAPASPELTAEQSEQAEAAVAAYRGYWTALDNALADPQKVSDRDIERYAGGAELRDVLSYVSHTRNLDYKVVGRHQIEPTVAGLRNGIATISDCIDTTSADIVDRAGASIKDTAAPARYPAEASVAQASSGIWLVVRLNEDRAGSC